MALPANSGFDLVSVLISDLASVHIAVFWTVFSPAAWAVSEWPSRKERVRSLYASLTRRFTRLRATALLSTFFAATKPTKGILTALNVCFAPGAFLSLLARGTTYKVTRRVFTFFRPV